jgi:hypothetical protein
MVRIEAYELAFAEGALRRSGCFSVDVDIDMQNGRAKASADESGRHRFREGSLELPIGAGRAPERAQNGLTHGIANKIQLALPPFRTEGILIAARPSVIADGIGEFGRELASRKGGLDLEAKCALESACHPGRAHEKKGYADRRREHRQRPKAPHRPAPRRKLPVVTSLTSRDIVSAEKPEEMIMPKLKAVNGNKSAGESKESRKTSRKPCPH